jgi:hypothetical protein
LEKSAEFFRLDHTHPPDLSVLTHILAEIVFGTRRRGKRKGDYKIWTEKRFLELASKYHELKARNPTCLDNELAELISKTGAFWEYHDNSEPIRQRLPKAKAIPREAWLKYKREQAEWLRGNWFESDSTDLADGYENESDKSGA